MLRSLSAVSQRRTWLLVDAPHLPVLKAVLRANLFAPLLILVLLGLLNAPAVGEAHLSTHMPANVLSAVELCHGGVDM